MASIALTGCGEKPYSPDTATPAAQPTAENLAQSDTGTANKEYGTPGSGKSRKNVLLPEASGTTVYEEGVVKIDASNVSEGYYMVSYSGSAPKARVLMTGPSSVQYNYRLSGGGQYDTIPFSDGNGSYHIEVYESTTGDKYAHLYSLNLAVDMSDPNKAFLYSNQYVNFEKSTQAIAKGEELSNNAADELTLVEIVYHYVCDNVKYDHEKAKTVQTGYRPVVDETLSTGKGICFDYSALMCTMLRTEGIPCRLEIGYREDLYHAWISVYTDETGWIDDIIVFDGNEWSMMDPTLASERDNNTVKNYLDNKKSIYTLMYKY